MLFDGYSGGQNYKCRAADAQYYSCVMEEVMLVEWGYFTALTHYCGRHDYAMILVK